MAAPPRGLAALLDWYRSAWESEIPSRTHRRGVWHDSQAASALGAPALAAAFSTYLMGSPHATDYDPRVDTWTQGAVHLMPMHAVLADMAGKDANSDGAYRAHWLLRLACMAWNVEDAAAGLMPPQVARVYTYDALVRAWRMYARCASARVAA